MGGVFLLLSKISFYGTTLILIILILVLSFKFNKKMDNNKDGKVSDEYIASYFDGEYQNEIPGKDDGYVVDKIVCDNGATGTWDNEEWGINIRNATKKIKCSVFFKQLSMADQILELSATDTTNFATDDPDNNIRYIGANPNNYVYFNCSDYSNQSDSTCEKWRIIGVFKNMTKEDGSKADLVKIIRNDFIGESKWDISDYNDWSEALLQRTLNGEYYNGTYATGALKNDTTRNAIESVVWNLGGNVHALTASEYYADERGTTVYRGNATTWIGKIGLMYPSDYGYATSGGSTADRATCMAKGLYYWDDSDVSDCKNNDYLFFKSGYEQWTLTHSSWDVRSIYYVDHIGTVTKTNALNTRGVRPVAFLKSNILLSGVGDGSSNSPYQLKVG